MSDVYYIKNKDDVIVNSYIVHSIIDDLTQIDPQMIVEYGTLCKYKKDLFIAGDRFSVEFNYRSKDYGFLYEKIYNSSAAYLYYYHEGICLMIKPRPIYEDYITEYLLKLRRAIFTR
jgi:hypothetical protein